MEWYWILLIVLGSMALLITIMSIFYKPIFKRVCDIVLSGIALIVLSPLFLILIIAGSIAMKGNPFFTQERPGKHEKIFKLIKFRSMSNARDDSGKLLPDNKRINGYGKFIRKISFDELPELINIFIGQMSFVGPRPLLVEYLPWYTLDEKHRHDVRPGLTGLAQVKGRNTVNWDKRFQYDIDYVKNISILLDLKILFLTVACLFDKRNVEIITENEGNMAMIRKNKVKTILITGIGGLTPRSIAKRIREIRPNYRLIGCDVDPKAMGFFMHGLLDNYYIVPKCDNKEYFKVINKIVEKEKIDYAFVQPESEIVKWAEYYELNGKYPCPVLMGSKILSASLKDKSIMAELLKDTKYIPKTIKVSLQNPRYDDVEKIIGFPCWIRATEGTGGLGSLKIENIDSYRSWLNINSNISEFTISEFLSGRHLANQMLYYNGEYIKGASLECVEYVMANIAPSHVTGNTHFARFLNDNRINEFCDECIKLLEQKLNVKAHGILSFDLKEDKNGNLKVTEINIRHMAYTGVMAKIGFDLIEDTINILENGNCDSIIRDRFHHYDKNYVFLRDVDVEPIILDDESYFTKNKR